MTTSIDAPFADRLRSVLDARLPRRRTAALSLLGAGIDVRRSVDEGRAYLAAMTDGGWATPGWPVEWGGAGLSGDELDVFAELIDEYDRPDPYVFLIGLGTAGPMIIRHGSDEQRARYLEPIRTGAEVWCQLFSEPDAGSDLSALRTRARRDGDDWIVDGHKFWVSRAEVATWGLLLARTNPDAPPRRGITTFILPMSEPGVSISPIRQMNDDAHFYEVFLDRVRIPDSQRLGPVDAGWTIALETLGAERGAAGSLGGVGMAPHAVVDLLAAHPAATDPLVRQHAARAYTALRLLELGRNGPLVEGAKLRFSSAARSFIDLTRRVRGTDALLDDGHLTLLELTSPSLSIRGGTDEIQRNVIGERVLGLPREPRPSGG